MKDRNRTQKAVRSLVSVSGGVFQLSLYVVIETFLVGLLPFKVSIGRPVENLRVMSTGDALWEFGSPSLC